MTRHAPRSQERRPRRTGWARLLRVPAALSYEIVDDMESNDAIRRAFERQSRWLTGYFTAVAIVWLALWELLRP